MNNQYSHMTKEQEQDDADMNRQIRKMRKQGLSILKISQYTGLSPNSVRRRLESTTDDDNSQSTKAYNPNNLQDFANSHRPHYPI